MWRFVPGKGFSYLTGDPLGRRIGGHADPNKFPSQMTDDHEAIEQLERDGAHDQQIDGRDAGGVVARNVFQPCELGRSRRPRYLATVD